jgi:hypothetical protein
MAEHENLDEKAQEIINLYSVLVKIKASSHQESVIGCAKSFYKVQDGVPDHPVFEEIARDALEFRRKCKEKIESRYRELLESK